MVELYPAVELGSALEVNDWTAASTYCSTVELLSLCLLLSLSRY